jgi:DHA1 family bicyclomycin/chloramphenicol resistance-like MFS transporter
LFILTGNHSGFGKTQIEIINAAERLGVKQVVTFSALGLFKSKFSFEGVVIALFFILLSIGFIYPNSVSRALSPFKELSGSASTMNGSFMMAMSAIITAVVGSLGMLMPFVMFAVMTCASILAILIFSIARNSK